MNSVKHVKEWSTRVSRVSQLSQRSRRGKKPSLNSTEETTTCYQSQVKTGQEDRATLSWGKPFTQHQRTEAAKLMQTWPSELWRHSAKQLNMCNLNTLCWSQGEETITANTKKTTEKTEKNTTIMEGNCINVLIPRVYPLVSSRLVCLKIRNKLVSMLPFTSAMQACLKTQAVRQGKKDK